MNRHVFILMIILLALAACINTTPEEPATDPVIESVTLNYSQTNKSLFISADVFDPQGLETIDSVVFYLYHRDSLDSADEELFRNGYLYDVGPPLDIINRDGVFSYLLDSTALADNEGYYRVSVQAFDEDGNSSNIEEQEALVAPNSPPELFAINLPNSFEKGDYVVFKIRVTDPQGYQEIASVIFSVLQPNGSYQTGDSWYLSDAGLASGGWGDEIANDGIFTVTVPTNPNSVLQGDFTFYFYAEDIHGAVSDTLKKILTNPGVHLLSPNMADTLQPYQTHKITWESAYINKVTIQYTTNANSSSPNYKIVATEFAVKGFYDWAIPYEHFSANCKIKIFDADKPSRYDTSDNSFTIKP
ncbi:MAG: hypothetical protein Q7J65_01145 [Candidatus Marinimicrobia bacterium]|nr:hypothetical protein [Candidatus Neomarinimicrobiota bacterium]